jgi:energy-coupling factor transporter ATP-binding protein EcfA2
MTVMNWQWRGARWWKFDLHTHTPASYDYGKGTTQVQLKERTPKDWLLDFMRAKIDCVAITDHNSGLWIDPLNTALADLRRDKPDGFRPLHLFPGVEISVHGGVHVLAILGSERSTSDVDSLLGAAGYAGTKGSSDAVTTKSFSDVVNAIKSAGGIAIPAHADGLNGLFTEKGTTLEQALHCPEVFAIELVSSSAAKPPLFAQKGITWTEVLGSDSHHPSGIAPQRCPGSHFTWVKMGAPNIDGLRLALLDGSLSVRRSDRETGDPNEHAGLVLEEVEVRHARYMGRAKPFIAKMNPWLNTVIGGRGTGKSTLVEFLRLALRRTNELPKELHLELEKYGEVSVNRDDGGLLTNETSIVVTYRKNGSRFRVQWSPTGTLDPIQEERGEQWVRAEGDVQQRFPVRMYSQKQIFQLAKTPLALLRIIDDAPGVDRGSWDDRWKQQETRYLALRAKAREIEAGAAEEPRLRGELDDVKRKMAIFEEAGHADVLKAFQRRRWQQQAVDAWEKVWAPTGDRLRELSSELVPDPLDETAFGAEATEDVALLQRASAARGRLEEIRHDLEQLAGQADETIAAWKQARASSAWTQAVDGTLNTYGHLRQSLADQGAGDPSAYGELVQRRQTIEQRLQELSERKKQVGQMRKQADASLVRLVEIRRDLTRARERFLDNVLQGNRYVHIQVLPYGARETVESGLRRILQREGGGFEKDIGSPGREGLLGKLYPDGADPAAIEQAVAGLKRDIHKIAAGQHEATLGDRRFATHIGRLPPEALDRLDLWFPEDSLDVQYSTTGDGHGFRRIHEGSPGQRTAALLAFLLSYGEEPLVLDQPEDDLDNHLIYDLIVRQVREVKRRRQIVVVTHNANIVVNGDAELVVALVAKGGETQEECAGSLQEMAVRDTICTVMEGGLKAFEQRYRRIVLEGRHV